MKALGILPKRFRSLDYGAGKGVLLRLLLDDGQDAWGYDSYASPAFAEERVLQEIPSGLFDLITAIEVIEHTLDPVPTLKQIKKQLAPEGILALSTEFFDAATHGPEWHYLAPEHGQHITIFSPKGFKMAAEEVGLRWLGSLALNKQNFLHLLCHPERQISRWTLFRLNLRHRSRERKANRDRFA
jgi:SAM-dependent methyltransferase